MTMRYLTQPEVADILRCSTSKITRLRLSGQLSYIPGRPVLISESDLNDYLQERTRRAEARTTKKVVMETDSDARKWALQTLLLRPDSRKRLPKS